MAQTVNVNFRLDEADKKRMENVCNELGLSMSAAFLASSSLPLDISFGISPARQAESAIMPS